MKRYIHGEDTLSGCKMVESWAKRWMLSEAKKKRNNRHLSNRYFNEMKEIVIPERESNALWSSSKKEHIAQKGVVDTPKMKPWHWYIEFVFQVICSLKTDEALE